MLQNKTSSAPTFAKTTTMATQNEKQCNIVKRLEELNKWQEEQKRLLEERQNRQRQILGIEQQTMYEMLGLCGENTAGDPLDNRNSKEELQQKQHKQQNSQESMENMPIKEDADSADYEDVEDFIGEYTEEDFEECKDVLETEDKLPDINSLNYMNPAYANAFKEPFKAKKPYLKRGEGLKQRFKIDPNELRLNNLPRYKYANAHPHFTTKPIPKRRPGVAQNDLVKHKKSENECIIPHVQPPPLEANEQRFQQILLTSKNTCNSTPDPKSTLTNNSESPQRARSSSSPGRVRFSDANNAAVPKLREYPPNEGPTPQGTSVAWCQILDPKQVQPITVRRSGVQASSPQPEIDIFDLIQRKAQSGADMNSSAVQNYMQRCLYENCNGFADEKQQISSTTDLKTKRLQPLVVPDAIAPEVSSVDEIEDECETETEAENETDNSLDNDGGNNNKCLESNDYSNITPSPSPEVRVRFTDSNDTREYDKTENNHLIGNKDDSHDEFFQQFKNALFAALQLKADNPNDTNSTPSTTTLTPKDSDLIHAAIQKATAELQEKTDLIKLRLCELEREINTFKENNVQLMKIKQEHELEKNLQAQEHLEAMGRLKDEKIQIEIRLHEERMKLEEERRKLEQQYRSKTQAFMAKERKEVEKLREQLVQIETQLKGKEHTHMAAQARLRSQMRNTERDQKKLHEEIERLTKENKRLEGENLRISREQNNKLLQEINRNIARLASPKAVLENNKGRLTPRKSVSKTIVTAAVVNRLQRQSAMGYFQAPKKSKAGNRSSKNGDKHNKMSLTSGAETETTPDTSISEDTSSQKAELPAQDAYCLTEQQQEQRRQYEEGLPIGIEDNKEEEDDDILREMDCNPENMVGFHDQAQYIEEQPPARLKSGESPLPPPSSPTATLAPVANNMKREIINADGSRDIWYPNGNVKKISADGMITRMLYYNKDVKETNVNDGTVKYYYAETNTWHTTYLDGLNILEFPTGQIEHRHKNGVIEIHYPNNSVKIFNPNDEHKLEEWRFGDGTNLVQMRNGDRILMLPNGQKEIHTKNNKRREYPDGTVKTVYKDGSQETRYSNGRVRLKDKDGNLVLDTDSKP
ncbi:spindle assembly abnormal 4 isoform 1-T2 [Glossina fuscipes fuscipes]